MTARKELSSLPLLLAVSGVILLSATGGWLLPGRSNNAGVETQATTDFPRPDDLRRAIVTAPSIDVDAELRKARLAADADMLVSPPEQNAFDFYARVVTADPGHAVANAEFDALLARISMLVSNHLIAGEFDDAYRLAVRVARERPDHALVATMRQGLTEYADGLVALAQGHAEAARDDEALAMLDTVAALPGLSATYVANARNAVSGIQQARLDEERAQLEQAQLAEEQELLEWIETVRGAIRNGRLVAPENDSALYHLGTRDAPAGVVSELEREIYLALIAAIEDDLGQGALDDAAMHLDAAEEIANDDADRETLAGLEDALVDAASNRLIGLTDLVPVDTAPAVYPRHAYLANVTGWVDVTFTVTTEGVTTDIVVLQAEPPEMFDAAATDAVSAWTFEPRRYRGRLVDQRASARLAFRLE